MRNHTQPDNHGGNPYFNTPNIQMIPSSKDVLCTRSYFQNNFHCTPNSRLGHWKLLLANHAAHAEVLPRFGRPFQKGKICFRENRKMINLTFIEHELSLNVIYIHAKMLIPPSNHYFYSRNIFMSCIFLFLLFTLNYIKETIRNI